MGKGIIIIHVDELYDYSKHLKWASNDLGDTFHQVKAHATDFDMQWHDDASARFMNSLEVQEKTILELAEMLSAMSDYVEKHADMAQRYLDISKRF